MTTTRRNNRQSTVVAAVSLLCLASLGFGQSSMDKIMVHPDGALPRQTRGRERPPAMRAQPQSHTHHYDVVFDNFANLEITEAYLVVFNQMPAPTATALPDDSQVAALEIPPPGDKTSLNFRYVVDDKVPIPLAFVAVFGPRLAKPLWVRLPLSSASATVAASGDESGKSADALALALTIESSNAAAAAKRFKDIVSQYPGTAAAKTAQQKLGLSDAEAAKLSVPRTETAAEPDTHSVALAEAARQICVQQRQQAAAADAERQQRAAEAAAKVQAIAERDARIPVEMRPLSELIKQYCAANVARTKARQDWNDAKDEFDRYSRQADAEQWRETKLAALEKAQAANDAQRDSTERESDANERANAAIKEIKSYPPAAARQCRDIMLQAGEWGDIQGELTQFLR